MKKLSLFFFILILVLSACTSTVQETTQQQDHTPGLRDSRQLIEPQAEVSVEESVQNTTPTNPEPIENLTSPIPPSTATLTTSLGDFTYQVEVADTEALRQRGLMFRESMPLNQGMLFIFPQPNQVGFWMKNTLIPLDIIFINQDWEVVTIHQATPCKADPCPLYFPTELSLYVLELNLGQAQAIGLEEGDIISFSDER